MSENGAEKVEDLLKVLGLMLKRAVFGKTALCEANSRTVRLAIFFQRTSLDGITGCQQEGVIKSVR